MAFVLLTRDSLPKPMNLDLSQTLALVTGGGLIVLIVILYIRSRQGDQRVIAITNQMLLFILSAIVVTLNFVFPRQQMASACTGTLTTVKYVGVTVTLLLIAIGTARFFSSQSRDRRLITHPVLLALIMIIVTFLIEYLNRCI